MTIPATVSAARAVATGERFEGEVPVAGRLQEFAPGRLSAVIVASQDVAGTGWLKGDVRGTLSLPCQVCGKPYGWEFVLPLNLALARDEAEEEKLLAVAEPCLVENDRLKLHEVVEDEILLGLPMLPKCAACENDGPVGEDAPPEDRRPNPFAALKGSDLSGASGTRRK